MSATEAVHENNEAKSTHSMDKTTKNVIEEIKKTSGAEKVKLVGLFKQLSDVKAADEAFDNKTSTLEFESHKRLTALFQQAFQLYKHETPFTKASIKDPSLFFTEEELADPNFEKVEGDAPAHPWFTLLTKVDIINAYITEKDEEVLKHLIKVETTLHPDSEDFEVEFTFEPNEFFSNEKLKLECVCDGSAEDGDCIEDIKCPEIEWKEGKDPRFEERKTKAKTKKGKKIPGKIVKERTESFFWLFKEHTKASVDADEEDEEEEDGPDPLSDGSLYHQACDILDLLKKNVFTYAIPAMFGLKPEELSGMPDMDEETLQGVKNQIDNGQKPECKQQ